MILEKSTDFESIISEGLVIVDFFATWCGPCKMISPILEKFADENKDIKVLKVDVDEFSPIANKFQIHSIPTLLLFKNGELIDKKVGFTDYNGLVKFTSGR